MQQIKQRGSNEQKTFADDTSIFTVHEAVWDSDLFGYPLAEIRLATRSEGPSSSLSDLPGYLSRNGFRIGTFRGREDIKVIRALSDIGFQFVQTLNTVACEPSLFRPITHLSKLSVEEGNGSDHFQILTIAKSVFDYSTMQIDPMIEPALARKRNETKARNYLSRPDQITYVIRLQGKAAGYLIFSQAVRGIAQAEAAGVLPEFQGTLIGAALYSHSFQRLFDSGIKTISAGYSAQNFRVGQLYHALGFQLTQQETHLRIFL